MSILPRQSATLCVLRAQRRNGELSLQRGANLQLPTLPLSGPRTKHIRPPSGNSSSRAARVSTIASGGAASVSGQGEWGVQLSLCTRPALFSAACAPQQLCRPRASVSTRWWYCDTDLATARHTATWHAGHRTDAPVKLCHRRAAALRRRLHPRRRQPPLRLGQRRRMRWRRALCLPSAWARCGSSSVCSSLADGVPSPQPLHLQAGRTRRRGNPVARWPAGACTAYLSSCSRWTCHST